MPTLALGNPSFEVPGLGPGGYREAPAVAPGQGWLFEARSPNTDCGIAHTGASFLSGIAPPPDGAQCGVLVGAGGIVQFPVFPLSANYVVTLWATVSNVNPFAAVPTSASLNLFVFPSWRASWTVARTGAWQKFGVTLAMPGSSAPLTFALQGPGAPHPGGFFGSFGTVLVDLVSVTYLDLIRLTHAPGAETVRHRTPSGRTSRLVHHG